MGVLGLGTNDFFVYKLFAIVPTGFYGFLSWVQLAVQELILVLSQPARWNQPVGSDAVWLASTGRYGPCLVTGKTVWSIIKCLPYVSTLAAALILICYPNGLSSNSLLLQCVINSVNDDWSGCVVGLIDMDYVNCAILAWVSWSLTEPWSQLTVIRRQLDFCLQTMLLLFWCCHD